MHSHRKPPAATVESELDVPGEEFGYALGRVISDACDEVAEICLGVNDGTLTPHVRLKHLPKEPCPHYPPDQVGDPVFKKL